MSRHTSTPTHPHPHITCVHMIYTHISYMIYTWHVCLWFTHTDTHTHTILVHIIYIAHIKCDICVHMIYTHSHTHTYHVCAYDIHRTYEVWCMHISCMICDIHHVFTYDLNTLHHGHTTCVHVQYIAHMSAVYAHVMGDIWYTSYTCISYIIYTVHMNTGVATVFIWTIATVFIWTLSQHQHTICVHVTYIYVYYMCAYDKHRYAMVYSTHKCTHVYTDTLMYTHIYVYVYMHGRITYAYMYVYVHVWVY